MTDAEFAEFCAEHPDLWFEVTAEGELLVAPPAFTLTGIRNADITSQLGNWADRDRLGLVCGPCAGFVLPNGARRSPDASWTARSEILKLSREIFEGYWRLCPAFVVEIRSHYSLGVLRAKMREYIENGAQLGWMIDPETETVEVYRPGREPELLADLESLAGEGPVDGFVLDLRTVWDPLS